MILKSCFIMSFIVQDELLTDIIENENLISLLLLLFRITSYIIHFRSSITFTSAGSHFTLSNPSFASHFAASCSFK